MVMLTEYSQGKYSGAGNSGLQSTEVSCRMGTEVPAFRTSEVFQRQAPDMPETDGPARGRYAVTEKVIR